MSIRILLHAELMHVSWAAPSAVWKPNESVSISASISASVTIAIDVVATFATAVASAVAAANSSPTRRKHSLGLWNVDQLESHDWNSPGAEQEDH